MSVVYAIANQKGGVGKTTTAQNLAAGLSARGYKVLMIDMDAQANLTYAAGVDGDDARTMYDVFQGDCHIEDTIIETEHGDLVPANLGMAGLELTFQQPGREYMLKKAIVQVRADYDYIVIDTPPALGVPTINAFVACDRVIVPIGADVFSLNGVTMLYKAISQAKEYYNSGLEIDGILVTKSDPSRNISKSIIPVVEKFVTAASTRVYRTWIRSTTKVPEAQACREGIYQSAPKSTAAEDYNMFVDELLGRV